MQIWVAGELAAAVMVVMVVSSLVDVPVVRLADGGAVRGPAPWRWGRRQAASLGMATLTMYSAMAALVVP